jgi:hypothetical protein
MTAREFIELATLFPEKIVKIPEQERLAILNVILDLPEVELLAKIAMAIHVGPSGIVNFLAWLAGNPDLEKIRANHHLGLLEESSYISEDDHMVDTLLADRRVRQAIEAFQEVVAIRRSRFQPIAAEA